MGIGTTNPSNDLEIRGDAGNGVAGFFRTDLAGSKSHILFGNNGDWYIRPSLSTGKIVIADNGGNVGIGTDTPTTTLHINDVMRLEPRNTEPNCAGSDDEGTIYYDDTLRKLRVCVDDGDGITFRWVNLH